VDLYDFVDPAEGRGSTSAGRRGREEEEEEEEEEKGEGERRRRVSGGAAASSCGARMRALMRAPHEGGREER
jgi:hypothetical protein